MAYYTELEKRLLELKDSQSEFIVSPEDINGNNINEYRKILRKNGILVLKNAITKESVKRSIKDIGNNIIDMFTTEGYGSVVLPEETVEILKNASDFEDLMEFNKFRNSKCPWGNLSFSYLYKMKANQNDYMKFKLSDENFCYFDYMPSYISNLKLLADNDNEKITAIHFALTHVEGSQISWDSIKVGTLPRNSLERKSMTQQKNTEMHMDIYDKSVERWQVIDNYDIGNVKLFFLVGGKDEKVMEYIKKIERIENKSGFIKILDPKLQKIIKKYSVAPCPTDRVYWDSGVPHFESVSSKLNEFGLYIPAKNSELIKENKKCIRWVNGTNKIKGLTKGDHKKIALANLFGFCPAVYDKINRKSIIFPNIVNSKSTMFMKNRELTEKEIDFFEKVGNIMDSDDYEQIDQLISEKSNPKYSYMLGLINFEEAGFNKENMEIIANVNF